MQWQESEPQANSAVPEGLQGAFQSRPAQRYVALGDSYAAGIGAGNRLGDSWRTDAGYPVAVAESLGLDLAYQAVMGATVSDVLNNQVQAVGNETELVTISVGGNDVGFAPVVLAAAKPKWLSNLDEALVESRRVLNEELPGRLDALFAQVKSQAPLAEIVVTGYPHLFGGKDNHPFTFFSAEDMRELNEASDELNDVIKDACERSGASFVDVRASYRGHEVFASKPWINGLTWPVHNSFHPNEQGHRAYADAVREGVSRVMAKQHPTAIPEQPREPKVVQGAVPKGSAPTFRLRDVLTGKTSAKRFAKQGSKSDGQDGEDPGAATSLKRRLTRYTKREAGRGKPQGR